MSAAILGAARTEHSTTRHAANLHVVDTGELATVRDISTAPSLQRKRARLLEEDPAIRRHPVFARHREAATPRPTLRSVVCTLSTLAAATTLSVGAGLYFQPDDYSGPTVAHSVTNGESVWSLAQAVDASRPLEQVVVDIERLNDIDGPLQVGQRLQIPAE